MIVSYGFILKVPTFGHHILFVNIGINMKHVMTYYSKTIILF